MPFRSKNAYPVHMETQAEMHNDGTEKPKFCIHVQRWKIFRKLEMILQKEGKMEQVM